MGKIKNFYGLTEPIENKSALRENFDKFADVVLRRLYNKSIYVGLDFVDDNLFDQDDLVLYLQKKDEACLQLPSHGNPDQQRGTGSACSDGLLR